MDFVAKLRSCISDPAFYAEARTGSVETAIKFLTIAVMARIVGVILVLAATLGPVLYNAHPLTAIENAFPQDLVMTFATGTLSINQPEPYLVPMPFKDTGLDYLAVIDTQTPFVPEDFTKYKTLTIFKKEFAVAASSREQKIVPFSNLATSTPLVVDRALIHQGIAAIPGYLGWILVGVGVFMAIIGGVVGTVVAVIYYLLYLVGIAAIVMTLARARSTVLSYKEAYITSVYATVPAVMLSLIIDVVHAVVPIIARPSLVFTALVLLIAFINTQPAPDHDATQAEA
jgi:hypothetical protein